MKRHEINFIWNGNTKEDIEQLLGPFDDNDGPIIEFDPDKWSMAHIMHRSGIFPSVSQARKNGWDRPIPDGYSQYTVGKRKLEVYILSRMPPERDQHDPQSDQ